MEQPTDLQIHRVALRHAANHRVSYAEALDAATAEARIWVEERKAQPSSDIIAMERAKSYAALHRVSFAEALAELAPEGSGGGEVQERRVPEPSTDALVDARAHRYAKAQGVSYSEALTAVVASAGQVHYSEATEDASRDDSAILQSQPIEIFKAGERTDSNGVARTFTDADIAAMAQGYEPALHEAPLIVGPPASDKPAYGWVQRLEAKAGRLLAHVQQVDAAFARMVKEGQFAKRIATFYGPQDANNPTPGRWYLRNVSWLGAEPPAVRGLRPAVAFTEAVQNDGVSFEASA